MKEKAAYLTKQIDKAISKGDVSLFMLTKIEALNTLSLMLGLFDRQSYPVDFKEINFRIRCLYIENMPFYFYVANSIILDCLFNEWRDCVGSEIISKTIDRKSPEVKIWRNSVIERDKKCIECGSNSNLHAHHVLNWANYPEYRINIDNGQTLCGECHADKHPELARGFVS